MEWEKRLDSNTGLIIAVCRPAEDDIARPIKIGQMRDDTANARGARQRHGASGNIRLHIEGAIGESVFAEVTGQHWHASVNAPKSKPDVGLDWQVRTRSRHWYDLLVRPDDADGQRFALVTTEDGEYIVWGWLWGFEAKRFPLEPHGGRDGAHFPPHQKLNRLFRSL